MAGASTAAIVLLIAFTIGTLIAAILLRFSCSLFNKWFGRGVVKEPKKPLQSADPYSSPQSFSAPMADVANAASPYAPPQAPIGVGKESLTYLRGVPVPSFGKAILICICYSAIQIVLRVASSLLIMQLGPSEAVLILAQVLGLLINFLILTTAIKIGLPTNFGRAAGVAGLFYLIALLIGISLGLVLVVFFSAVG